MSAIVEVPVYSIRILDCYQWSGEKDKWQDKVEAFQKAGFTPAVWDETDSSHKYFQEDQEMSVSKDELVALMVAGINLEVKREIRVAVNVADELAKLAEKPIQLLQAPSEANYNNRCEVHIPGQALSTYNDIMLLEDACSDVLQEQLSRGWRIIAGCPQPDQRRPDYILGRFNPDVRVDGKSAERE